jgi:hypothetical protein
MIYLTSLSEAMKDFITVNFKGFSYDGIKCNDDLNDFFFFLNTLEEKVVYFHYKKHTMNNNGTIISIDKAVKFFDFNYGVTDFVKALVCDRLVVNVDNHYDVQKLINFCINDMLLPFNIKLNDDYLKNLCSHKYCSIGIVLYCEYRDFIV